MSEEDPLLQPVPEGGDWRGNAVIGGWTESDWTLAAGFIDAADVLVAYWRSHRNDTLVPPLLYSYRHGIELALKIGIRDAATCARRDGAVDDKWEEAAVDGWLGRTHKIEELTTLLNEALGLLRGNVGTPNAQLPAETVEVLDWLHELDATGQALRYVTVKIQGQLARARPDQRLVDVPRLAEKLREAATLVLYGVSGMLDAYREYQQSIGQAGP